MRVLRNEWRAMVVDPVRRLARRGLSALLLAFVAAFGVIFFHAIAQHPGGERAVRLVGGVQGDLPLWLALLRTPVSLYVPALDLPVWAGITQLFLAFALAELTLGRTRTLFISYATTLAGTLTVRVMIAMGPGRWGLGLPPETGHVLDTGPSAAVVGLFTYLSVVRRAPVVFLLTGGSMVVESLVKPNLAGREHLIAVATALVLALIDERAWRRLRWPAWRERKPDGRTPGAAGPVRGGAARPALALTRDRGRGRDEEHGPAPGRGTVPTAPWRGTGPAARPPGPSRPTRPPAGVARPDGVTAGAARPDGVTAGAARSDGKAAGAPRPDRPTAGTVRPGAVVDPGAVAGPVEEPGGSAVSGEPEMSGRPTRPTLSR
ncbi:hypothetical protein [Streptomyces sp. NPDC018610]|uniref:hypothetical protein n=1 Tax=Streptomyces sp. NPDC018610 TaxID=3365049 RepID=UPI0037A887AA